MGAWQSLCEAPIEGGSLYEGLCYGGFTKLPERGLVCYGSWQSPCEAPIEKALFYKGHHYGGFTKPLQSSYREGLHYGSWQCPLNLL